MRFGKTNGWALIALGIFLILLQGALGLMPKSDKKSPQDVPITEHKRNYLPSILGGVFFLAGAAIILKSKDDSTRTEVRPQ
jgi:hypothetical protein